MIDKLKIKEVYINSREIIRVIKHNIFNRNKKYIDKRFGTDKRQYYRIYKNRKSSKGTVFFIHGGGWWHGSPESFSLVGEFFYNQGYTVVMPSYRLVPTHLYPTQINDVIMAFEDYINSDFYNKKINKKIVIGGFSAGGELAINLIFNNTLREENRFVFQNVVGILILSGVLDFEKCYDEHAIHLIKNYIGEEEYRSKNPISLLKKEYIIDLMCIHGEDDPLISVDSSVSFVSEYLNLGGNAKINIIKGKQHRDILELISVGEDCNNSFIIEFLKRLN